MRGSMKLVSMLLVLCLMLGALPLAMAEEVVDADLTCTRSEERRVGKECRL